MAYPSDLVRTKDWGNETLTDSDLEGQFDLIINWVMAALNASTGHKHDGTSNEGPKINSNGFDQTDNYTFTGAITSDELQLAEQASAPSTGANEGVIYTKESGGQSELFYREESDGDEVQLTNGGSISAPSGSVIQAVYASTGAVATGTTTIPNDDTIPQITEGDEYETIAITPSNASNTLYIHVSMTGSWSSNQDLGTAALFQDSTANALATGYFTARSGAMSTCSFVYKMAAGTTSSTTFRVRIGGQSGTFTLNGVGGARKHGGVSISSIAVYEVKA